jgi:hypothetical protein
MGASSSVPSRFPSRNPDRGPQPNDPVLKRTASLPSRPPERAEVRPERKPITRARPDANPPAHFRSGGDPLWSSRRKIDFILGNAFDYAYFMHKIQVNPEYLDVIKSRHPHFESYSPEGKAETFPLLDRHPRFLAEMAKDRNERISIPNGPTASRTMTPGEQEFLTHAFRELQEDYRSNPFHIHGETAVVGNKQGEVIQFNYSPEAECYAFPAKENRYDLHTHPPFGEPFVSSASVQDQLTAAELYRSFRHGPEDRPTVYVTNGKDVLHIQPDSTELVKLNPDPDLEKRLGKFPVAFRVPDPQPPPYPFSNHEAP